MGRAPDAADHEVGCSLNTEGSSISEETVPLCKAVESLVSFVAPVAKKAVSSGWKGSSAWKNRALKMRWSLVQIQPFPPSPVTTRRSYLPARPRQDQTEPLPSVPRIRLAVYGAWEGAEGATI